MTEETFPCFKCGNDITSENDIIMGAMTFISYGGYGSVYDPMNSREFLRIHICDICVIAAAVTGRVLEGTRVPAPDEVTYRKTLWEHDKG